MLEPRPWPPLLLSFVFGIKAEVDESVVGEGGGHQDVASVAAVTAGWTALGDELHAAEGHTAAATVASLDSDSCFVE